jgi:hypothetical protein
MRRPLFGELLSRLVGLSDHDIAEVLADQAISHRRFGEIAMAFQWVRPQEVWQAWWAQLGQSTEEVALPAVGIDTQALGYVPRSVAEEYLVIPIRAYGDQLVLATTDRSQARAALHLPALLNKAIRFVVAPEAQIREAIGSLYRHQVN